LDDVNVVNPEAVSVDALVTNVPLSVFNVRSFELLLAIVPPFANVILVASNAIVSILSTPVNAPAVSTFNPVDVKEKSPVALPIVVLLPSTEERVVFPHDVRSVNIAVPGVEVPIDAKFAAPVADIFHCPSTNERLALVLPIVVAPE
jgi:hypothetical protein